MAATTTSAQAQALERANLYKGFSAPASNSWKDRTVDIGGGQRLYLTAEGHIAGERHAKDIKDIDSGRDDPNFMANVTRFLSMSGAGGGAQKQVARTNLLATKRSAADLNKYLSDNADNEYSLAPGEGKAVVGYRTVTLEGGPKGHVTRDVPIYGRVSPKAAAPSGPSAPSTASAPAVPAPGTTERDKEVQNLYDKAEDTIYWRNSAVQRPLLETNVSPGQGTDAVARYGNQLTNTNRIFSSAMNDRAQAGSYQMGRMLQYAASGLPAAPKADGTDDLITAIKKVNELKLFA